MLSGLQMDEEGMTAPCMSFIEKKEGPRREGPCLSCGGFSKDSACQCDESQTSSSHLYMSYSLA